MKQWWQCPGCGWIYESPIEAQEVLCAKFTKKVSMKLLPGEPEQPKVRKVRRVKRAS